MSFFLGIDYGTSGFKVQAFDEIGQCLAYKQGQVPLERQQPGWVEQDIEYGWKRLCQAIRELLAESGLEPTSIKGIGTTGTSNLSLLDASGRTMRPAILYGDTRLPSDEEMEIIKAEIGAGRIGAGFGFHEMDDARWTIVLQLLPSAKLLWLRSHEGELFQRARSCLTSSWDFIHFRLTGQITHWSGSLDADRAIAERFGIPLEWFGEGRGTGEIAGTICAPGALESGLAQGTPVVLGGTDSLCMFLGAGLTRAGMGLNAAGTTDVVAVALAERPRAAIGYPVEHLIPGLWMLSLSPVRGPTLAWFRDLLLGSQASYAELDQLASQAPPGSSGLICLPYFSGEKGVVHDPAARGMLVGLDLQHGQPHLARSVLEAIAHSLRQIVETYEAQGAPVRELRLAGGGAKSELWNRIKADVLGREIHVLQVLETGCLGAAILASVAVGHYPDRRQACEMMTRVAKTIHPNPNTSEIYHQAQRVFQGLYPANERIFGELTTLRSKLSSGHGKD